MDVLGHFPYNKQNIEQLNFVRLGYILIESYI